MEKKYLVLATAMCTILLTACKEKKNTDTIIAPKPVKAVQRGPMDMQETKQEWDADWADKQYKILIVRTPDSSLPLAQDEAGQKYHDNTISVRILRADGSEFFAKTFTKTDFNQYLDDSTKKNGALLGIVFDKLENDHLRFAASVGSPDVLSDQYMPMVLTISRMGAVSIVKDNTLDAGGLEEEEGV